MAIGYGNWFHTYIPGLHLSNTILTIAFGVRWHTDPSCHFDRSHSSHHLEIKQQFWITLDGNVFLLVWLYLVCSVPQSTTHFFSPSRFNSLLFQLDFFITGNSPLKDISIYGHLLLMCFFHHFSSLSEWNRDKAYTFQLEQPYPPFQRWLFMWQRMEYISHRLKMVSFLFWCSVPVLTVRWSY